MRLPVPTRRQRTPLLAFLVALFVLVTASPLDLDDDELPSPHGPRHRRAKYVGSRCTNDAECYSENCAATNGTSKLTCQRQPVEGRCFKDAQLHQPKLRKELRHLHGTVRTPKARVRPTAIATSCSSISTATRASASSGDGSACVRDGQCSTGHCIERICRLLPQGPNSDCFDGSECLSGRCDVPEDECTNPDGSFRYCDYPNNGHSICARYSLGHACANNGECDEGLCEDGVCTASQAGDRCKEQYQYSNGTLCSPQDICYNPTNGTVHPEDRCNQDSQCLSGRCLDEHKHTHPSGPSR
ncbi:hypothetical protein V8E36_006937 [Tilletia maclaganii]